VRSLDPGAAVVPTSGTPSPTAPGGSPAPSDSAATGPGTGGGDAPSPTPVPSTTQGKVAVVPVVNFRSGRTTARVADVAGIGTAGSPYAGLVLVKRDAAAILAALKVDAGSLGTRLTTVASAGALAASLATHRTWLGFLRADEVGPSVHALSWGSQSMFGETRVASLAAWKFTANLAVAAGAAPGYDPASAWTVFAAGDLALDRGAALAIKQHPARGSNFLYDGGNVAITGHCPKCSSFGWDLPYTKRLGGGGASGVVRTAIKGADLAIANMEEVAVTNWSYHAHGTVFTGNPAYLTGIRNAGFDWVSMGNNHVGDFGAAGVTQAMGYLDAHGLLHGGAGVNTKAAHKPSIITVGNVKVALLSYDTVANVYNATSAKAGSARMTPAGLKVDITAARNAGADVVIVWPHWGIEYTTGPSAFQVGLGHAAIDAGADLVIGNHPHWAQAMEVYKGRPIWYALGNFTFDQTWSEPTMEGITLELTFSGRTLVQARMRPHLVLFMAQPNFMDPLGSGKAVMNQVFGASKNLSW
jgi:poly-gamma-glutamate capsule biosynthesis protein CapA/YwtB (metallophosphatase superfamily)